MICGQSNCPCPKVPGCESFAGDPFTDCRYEVQAGTVEGTEVGSDAYILIRHGWSGVDGNCEEDPTQLIEATFSAAAGDVVRLHVDVAASGDSHYAELTINPDEETLGTLLLSKSGPELISMEVDAPPGTHTLRVCYDQVTLTAVLGGSRLEADSEGWGGLLAGISTGDVADVVTFSAVTVSHKLYDTACADCVETVECDKCEDGSAPGGFLVTIFDHCFSEFNRSYIVRFNPLLQFNWCLQNPSGGTYPSCEWMLDEIPFPRGGEAGTYRVILQIASAGAGLIKMRVVISASEIDPACGSHRWVYELPDAIANDCFDIGEQTLPFFCYSNGSFGVGCNIDPCAPDETENLSYARVRNL